MIQTKKEKSDYQKAYRVIHRDRILAKRRIYYLSHKKEQRDYYFAHREEQRAYNNAHREKRLLYAKKNHAAMKAKIMEHYSQSPPSCACCGEKGIQFLTIDHVNNGGAEHRKTLGKTSSGWGLYRWIIKNNYPPMFQVLCFNCNCAKGLFGECPHQHWETA